MKKLLIVFTLTPFLLLAQTRKQRKALEAQQKADQQVIVSLKKHIQSLTANTNTDSAFTGQVQYLSDQFKLIGLQPKGTSGFVQQFQVEAGKQIEPSTYLKVDGHTLEVNKEYIPLAFSAEKTVSGMPAMALREKGVPWFTDVKDWLDDSKSQPDFKLKEAVQKEAAKVATKGATALFIYNSGTQPDSLAFDKKDKSSPVSIPVVYIMPDGYKKYFSDHSQLLDIEMNVAFKQKNLNLANVVGYINNNAPTTIVIAAHYNPGKIEEDANTRPVVNKGYDDNASGTAMMLELAKMLTTSKAKGNNYLFLALGGTDLGLAAAQYWLSNATVNTPVNYMVNLDMLGSYSTGNKLLVTGETTSPVFKEILSGIPDKNVEIASDASSSSATVPYYIYAKQIPMLSFSTGSHLSENGIDTEEKVNYDGELKIAKFINKLIEATDAKGRIDFAKGSEHTLESTIKVTVDGK